MTIVKSSIISKPKSTVKSLIKSKSDSVDIFSNSQLTDAISKNRQNEAYADDNCFESLSEDEESQAP